MTQEDLSQNEAIRHTMNLYVRATDSGDFEALGETFAEAGVLLISHVGQTLNGRAAIVEALRKGAHRRGASEQGMFQRHHLTSSLIERISENEARAWTYVMVITELGPDHSGVYEDELVRQGDRWLFKRRSATMDWLRPDSRWCRVVPAHIRSNDADGAEAGAQG